MRYLALVAQKTVEHVLVFEQRIAALGEGKLRHAEVL
jgi:hypothetical protein